MLSSNAAVLITSVPFRKGTFAPYLVPVPRYDILNIAGRYLAVALRLKERHPATVRCTLQWVSPDLHGSPVTNEQIALDQAAGGWKYVALRSASPLGRTHTGCNPTDVAAAEQQWWRRGWAYCYNRLQYTTHNAASSALISCCDRSECGRPFLVPHHTQPESRSCNCVCEPVCGMSASTALPRRILPCITALSKMYSLTRGSVARSLYIYILKHEC
jgi:hypothetical protein